jgi:hypothetical protein
MGVCLNKVYLRNPFHLNGSIDVCIFAFELLMNQLLREVYTYSLFRKSGYIFARAVR